jgi:flagellar biosynthesis/type III secretory pathway ATPase
MPAMLRRRAAYLTLSIAEALRDQGLAVLCLIDSVTRFAMALREIYLATSPAPGRSPSTSRRSGSVGTPLRRKLPASSRRARPSSPAFWRAGSS